MALMEKGVIMATKRYKKICTVCGKEYEFCSGCREYALQPSWKNIYDNENCRNIFNILVDFKQKKISVAEAKEKINACDLSYKDDIRADLQEALNELLTADVTEIAIPVVEEVEKTVDNKTAINEEKEELEQTNDIVSEISGFRKETKKRKANAKNK